MEGTGVCVVCGMALERLGSPGAAGKGECDAGQPTGLLALPAVLTVPEVARLLQRSVSAIYMLAHAGRLPGRRIGRHWQFVRAELEQWLQQAPRRHATPSKQRGCGRR